MLMFLIPHASLYSVIVEDLQFLEKIQETSQKRNLCCQITLMLIRYVSDKELFSEKSSY
jgi:hypothetical protein